MGKQADIVNLLVKYYKEATHGIYLGNEEDEARSKRNDSRASQVIEKSVGVRSMEVKSKPRGGARCCMCFDPFSIQSVNVIVFFCCHAYHVTCLVDSTYTSEMKVSVANPSERVDDYGYGDSYGDDDGDDDDDTQSGGSRMRCILCTTAASGVK